MKRWKRLFFFVIFFVFAFVVAFYTIRSYFFNHPLCKDCNIVFISLDTLSANHLPCYGYDRNTAPNLCKFGEENIMFSDMHSNSSYTLPSHVSMFTGLYPSEHKVNTPNKDSLKKDVLFLPEILQNNGYQTYFYMPKYSSHLPIDNVYNRGINEIHDSFHPHDWLPGLQKLKQNEKEGKKTFLFLHTYWVHDPYILEDNSKRAYGTNSTSYKNIPTSWDSYYACDEKFIIYLEKVLKKELSESSKPSEINIRIYSEASYLLSNLNQSNIDTFCKDPNNYKYLTTTYIMSYRESQIDINSKAQISYLKDSYDSKIKELDKYMREVFDFIQKSELKKNTIIIVTSDHGEEFMEHGSWGHIVNLYETSTKVPFFMHIPGYSHIRSNISAQSVDIVPTLLNLIGIKTLTHKSGIDLFQHSIYQFIKQRLIYAEQLWFDLKIFTVREKEWKLFYKLNRKDYVPYELYNMKTDPGEKNNVIFLNNNKVKDLLKKIKTHL